METQITWEDPKPSRRKSQEVSLVPEKSMAKYKDYVEELKKNPNRWAIFKQEVSPTYSTRLKAAYPGIETACRRKQSSDGKIRFDIYARWIGESHARWVD